MFYFSATRRLAAGGTIKIFNHGNCMRDFTYVDDIVEGVWRVMRGAPVRSTGEDGLPLPRTPSTTSAAAGRRASWASSPAFRRSSCGPACCRRATTSGRAASMQPGDVPVTYADASALERDYGFRPAVVIREGLRAFCEWYKKYRPCSG